MGGHSSHRGTISLRTGLGVTSIAVSRVHFRFTEVEIRVAFPIRLVGTTDHWFPHNLVRCGQPAVHPPSTASAMQLHPVKGFSDAPCCMVVA